MRYRRRQQRSRSGGSAWAFLGILGALAALFGLALICWMTPLLLLMWFLGALDKCVAASKRAERRCRS
jgi:hypothetical protein